MAQTYLVYVGTYTEGCSEGIYACRFDASAGTLTALGLAAEIANPAYLAIHPNHRFLYSVSEIDNYGGRKSGAVTAFAIDAGTGKLALLNRVSSGGAKPCYLATDKSGKNILVANYGGGSIAVLAVQEDGRLGEMSAFVQHTGFSVDPVRQQAPHAHSAHAAPGNRFIIVADLGLDQLRVYRFDAARGLLAANNPPFASVNPGAGPRHLAFHPDGRHAYVINELQSTVTAFAYEPAGGTLRALQTLPTLPGGFGGENIAAEIQIDRRGTFLYASNRGHDSIVVFAVHSETGTLRPVERVSSLGEVPRHFGIDPTGSYLLVANQGSNNIAVFRINPETGRLTPTSPRLGVYCPSCVKFVPGD